MLNCLFLVSREKIVIFGNAITSSLKNSSSFAVGMKALKENKEEDAKAVAYIQQAMTESHKG